MAFYVMPDRKTVVEFRLYTIPCADGPNGPERREGIVIKLPEGEGFVPDSEIVEERLFAVHPDENTLCSRAADGTIIYQGAPLP